MKTLAIVFCSIMLLVASHVEAKSFHKHHHYKHPPRHVKNVLMTSRPASNIDRVRAKVILVASEDNLQSYFSKNDTDIRSIASITKMMTALVVLSHNQDMNEMLTVQKENEDHLKHTRSRLPVGTTLTREQFLHLALIASDNRAASVLGTNFPGGLDAFVDAMNQKAVDLGMTNSHFVDPTGLYNEDRSTARDLAILARAGSENPTIHDITHNLTYDIDINGRLQHFHNTDPLVGTWDTGVSKTGYIKESGKCLMMQVTIEDHPFIIVILDATGPGHRITAARSIKLWIEKHIIPTIKSNQVETVI